MASKPKKENRASGDGNPPMSPTDQLFEAIYSHPRFSSEDSLVIAVKRLIALGADLDAQRPNRHGPSRSCHTPLTLALCAGFEDCAIALIPGSSLGRKIKNNQGCDELMNACTHPKALAALLDAGADPLRQDDLGRTALMYALRFESNHAPLRAAPSPSSLCLRPCAALLLSVSDALAVDNEGLGLGDWARKSYQGDELDFTLAAIAARAEHQILERSLDPSLAPGSSRGFGPRL